MASTAAKAKRKAEAVNRLDDLAVIAADHFKVEIPDLKVTNKDPELGQIQQLEASADLLARILESVGVEVAPTQIEAVQDESEQGSADADENVEAEKKATKKSSKRTTRRKK